MSSLLLRTLRSLTLAPLCAVSTALHPPPRPPPPRQLGRAPCLCASTGVKTRRSMCVARGDRGAGSPLLTHCHSPSPHPPLPTPQALRKLNAKLAREGTERRAAERERYLKPKYQRQKAASDAIFRSAMRRKNILLSDLYRLDPSLAPFG